MPRRTVTINEANKHLYRTGSFNSSRLVWKCQRIDRQVLSNFSRLRKLIIRKHLVQNGLEGIQVCSSLRYLAIYRNCEIEPITALTNLVTLIINSPVRNIRPILNCTKLRTLKISTWLDGPATDLTGLENLRELRVLNVSRNVPVQFSILAQLPKLAQLSMDYTGDPAPLPSLRSLCVKKVDKNTEAQLKLCPHLRELILDGDHVFDLSWIQHMTRLESISMNDIRELKGTHAFRSFPRLKYLAYYNGTTNIISKMKYCPLLRTFDYGVGDFDSLDGLSTCSNLRSVCLFLGNRLDRTSSGPISIKGLAMCQKLVSFDGSQIILEDTDIISNWTLIENLDIGQTGVTDIAFLAPCTKLKRLDISDNGIGTISCLQAPCLISLGVKHTNITAVPFERFPLLESLYASECRIEDWHCLRLCPKLVDLDAQQCGLRTMDSIHAPNLSCAYLSQNSLTSFPFERFPLLRKFNASHNNFTNLDGIPSCPKIRTLNIEHNQITDFSPICHLPKLEYLHTANNPAPNQDPRTTRILQRFALEATRANIRARNIYSNSQNVHDSSIQLSVKKSVENLLKDPIVTYNPESVINSGLPADTVTTIINYCSCEAIHSDHDLTYAELFAYVWARIQKHEARLELYKILADQISDSECKCFTGRFNRTLSVLVGFYDDIFINISDSSRISAIVIAIGSKLDPYTAAQHVSDATKALTEAGYSMSDIQPWLEAISEP